MKLLSEIVDLLADQKGSLTDALLKTKVVLHKIGQKELCQWINDELTGYPLASAVPEYRVIPARVVGNLHVGNLLYSNQTLPISHLPDKERKHFTTNEMRDSIRVLEEFAFRPKGHLIHPIAPELYSMLGDGLENAWVQNAWIQMEPTQILNAVVEIRSRLLDFVLNLQERLGDSETDAEIRQVSETFDAKAMFRNVVFGDNATVVLGDNNAINVRNSIKRGDFNSLAEVLRVNGVEAVDIDALKSALDADNGKVDVAGRSFGPEVKGWLTKMMEKVVNTSWTIELGVAGGLLTNALQAYYLARRQNLWVDSGVFDFGLCQR